MSLSSVISAMQTRHGNLSGVASAPTAMPASLSTAQLPCALVFPGEGRHTARRVGERQRVRNLIVRVYVGPIAQGAGIDEGFQDVLTLLDTFCASYEQNTVIDSTAKVWGEFSDTGHIVSEFAGVAYHAFELSLQVLIL